MGAGSSIGTPPARAVSAPPCRCSARPVPPPRAPWVFSEVAGDLIDVVGWAPTWDETIKRGEGDRFWVAYLAEDRVIQLAVVNGAIPVEDARAFVERQPSRGELPELE